MENLLKVSTLGAQLLRNAGSLNVHNKVYLQVARNLSLTSVCSDRYPKYYIKPIYRPVDLEPLKESGEAAKLAFVPVRAAEVDENASVWHDPLVAKFTNMVMRMGRKVLARQLVEKVWPLPGI